MRLRASTLAETLVMMIVAGIVFLAVTDGLGMFMRLQTRRIAAMELNGRLRTGMQRLETLASTADSAVRSGMNTVICRHGREALLMLSDSAVIYRLDNFTDTLLTGVGHLRLISYGYAHDTLEVTVRVSDRILTARFGIQHDPQAEYYETIERLENEP